MSDDIFWPSDDPDRSSRETTPSGPVGTTSQPDAPTARQHTDWLGGGHGFGYQPTEPQQVQNSRAHRFPVALVAVVAATAAVFGAGGVAVGAMLVNNGNSSSTGSSGLISASPASDSHDSNNPESVAAIAKRVLPSVVSINVITGDGGDTGSGIVLRSDGYILTNNHVVAAATNGAGKISVTFNDGSSASAKIIGTDAEDDLAVIKADKTGLAPATLGTSSDLQVGDAVVAIGSPLGLSGTVTSGIVSALNRPVEASDSQTQSAPGSSQTETVPVYNAIQTDAAINPGNSGGALVDSHGDVVGINSAIASLSSDSSPFGGSSQSGSIGVGFAIPIDQAKVIANELITTGHANHPLLGVSLTDAENSDGDDLARVESVVAGTPAAKVGMKKGDIITAIDKIKTAGADAVIAEIRSHQPGEKVLVTWTDGPGGKSITRQVTLANAASAQG